jgi:DNA (cytosine-5)-methyltransferase 1
MRSLELFSGLGGLAHGLELAGAKHAAFVEFNKDACDSLRANFDERIVRHIDVRDFDFTSISDIDIIAGGPPCQPFSLGGKHNGNSDHRDMFPYAAKAVSLLYPKAFIFENVKGLLRDNFSSYFNYIIARLTYPTFEIKNGETWESHSIRLKKIRPSQYAELQYFVKFMLLNAADYGVPQVRERVVIVGIRSDLGSDWEFPQSTHSQSALEWAMRNDYSYWKRHAISKQLADRYLKFMERRSRVSEVPYGFISPSAKPWVTVRDAIGDLPDPRECHGIIGHKYQPGAKPYAGHTGSDLDWPSKTIKAGGHGVPGGENMLRQIDGSHRYFTILETKRIQTFPDSYIIMGSWGEAMRQIGNAVPVKLGKIIGDSVIDYIAKSKGRKAASA